jgi:hypothetical protein
MGKFSRDKGNRFERDVAIMLRTLDPSAKRCLTETQESGWDIITKLPLIIQCKSLVNWSTSPHKAYGEAERHAKAGLIPVLLARITHKSPDLAILSIKDFLALLEKAGYKVPQDDVPAV